MQGILMGLGAIDMSANEKCGVNQQAWCSHG